jgi:RNA polymerase sigma-70 factor (ECF subfamily)
MPAAEPESKPGAMVAGSGGSLDLELESRGPEVPPTDDTRGVPGVNRGARSPSKEIRAREAEEDRALIAKAQAGDTAAFRSLVERHQRRAFAIAYSLVRDEQDARELVQDAFIRVFKGLGTFKGGSSFFTWLYRIVTNLSIDLMRKPGRTPGGFSGLGDLDGKLDASADNDSENLDFPLLSRIDGSDPADVLRRREIAARIQTALDALPTYHRSVIVMREVEGLSYDEMAHVMGVSKGTIMSRLFHARQKLQKALYDCYEEQVGGVKAPRSAEETAPSSGKPASSGESS